MWKRMSLAGPSGVPLEKPGLSEGSMTETSSRATVPRNSTAGPSLVGLFASKRFAKRLTSKLSSRRDQYGSSSAGLIYEKEPTYRMEPYRKFSSPAVQNVISKVLNERLDGFRYNPKFCANMIKVLSEEIKDRVKVLGYDRYKIVCMVTLSQRKEQSMVVSSRCSWDQKLDNFSTFTFQNEHLICTASVYGIYAE